MAKNIFIKIGKFRILIAMPRRHLSEADESLRGQAAPLLPSLTFASSQEEEEAYMNTKAVVELTAGKHLNHYKSRLSLSSAAQLKIF